MTDRDLPPIPPDVSRLLDVERDRPGPVADARARVFERVASSLAGVPGGDDNSGGSEGGAGNSQPGDVPSNGSGLGAKSFTAAGNAIAQKIGIGLVSFAIGGASGVLLDRKVLHDESRTTAVTVTAPPLTADSKQPASPAALSSSEPVVTPNDLPRAPTATSPVAASTASVNRDADLTAERALVERGRAALERGNGIAALEALDRHASRYPRGQLTEEREALRVQSLVLADRLDDARTQAQRFRQRFPSSIFLPLVESAVH